MSRVSTITIVAVLATSSFSASSTEASVASVPWDSNALMISSSRDNKDGAETEFAKAIAILKATSPLSRQERVFYQARSERIEALKAEIYTCIASVDYDQSLWDLLVEEELPHRAFVRFAERSDVSEAFRDHPNIVVTDRDGRLRLTRDAMCAWARIHAELSA